MCDNKNEIHKNEFDKTKYNTSTRLDLDITETTDSYPEFDFLDLLRNLQLKEKKVKPKISNEETTNKSNPFSEEDSDVEAIAKLYEEKYGTCNDYAELGEGYDEEDSFIDNSDAVNDLVPSGIQTEFGGFYINRGKLNFVREDNSSSSTSEDVDKFLTHNRLNSRKITSDEENEGKESNKNQSNIHSSNSIINNNVISINSSNNNNNHSSHNNNNCNNNTNNINHNNNINTHPSNNNNSNHQSSLIKNRKRSGEYQHRSKKIRKTATPKIPDHLLHKKPFSGSLEYRKNINEFKKNKLKTVELDKKSNVTNLVLNNSINNISDNSNNNHSNIPSTVNINFNNNVSEDDAEKESANNKKKISVVAAKDFVKERDGATEVIEAVATGADVEKRYTSSSDPSESSSSESDSDSSEDTSNEKEKTVPKINEEGSAYKPQTVNGTIAKDITAKSFAQFSENLKELIAKILEISKEEKTKYFNSKLNTLLLSLDERLRELPMAERSALLEHVAEILQMKKDNITKRTKKLLVLQEETKMSAHLRKLKEIVTAMMPLLESNYFNEYTKAAGTSPQIYAELSRYYWSIDPSCLPQRKFPWNDELRHHLREVVQYRKNCYYIIRPRKESLIDYIRNFMETKVKSFWPKEWMTVDILLEEAQVNTSPSRLTEEKQKNISKMLGVQNQSNSIKKISSQVSSSGIGNRKQTATTGSPSSLSITASTGRKPTQTPTKSPEVKSVLMPRKTPSSSSSKSNISTASSLQNNIQNSRLQVSLNRLNVQEYLDRISGSQTSISRNPSHQTNPSRVQQSVSPNRLVKTSSPSAVLNTNVIRTNVSKNTSPNNINKSVSSNRNYSSSQSVLKTIEIHSNPSSGSKVSPNSVTISPVNESVFKDMTPSAEVLNLTKNSSVYISKVKDCGETKSGRSSSPSIGIPLPSGITISPTNASPSTFLTKPQKSVEKNPDVKINVSITKQESAMSLTKDKRESVLNINVKREGPLQNIPDCISVTSKVMPNERHKFEHVRKRALQEYHQQQKSPERLKPEEKKIKTEETLLTDLEIKEEKLDDKNFSKIFDSVIAKTSETVRQSESTVSHMNVERFGSDVSGMGVPVKNSVIGHGQYKNSSGKLRDMRTAKDKIYFSKTEGNDSIMDDRKCDESDERIENIKEQRVQMEMDRVMQNLVELSREKNSEYEFESQMSMTNNYYSNPSGIKAPSFQEAFQKMYK